MTKPLAAAEHTDRGLTKRAVADMIGVATCTVDRLEDADPDFPRRRQLSAGRVIWLESEVLAYLHSRPAGKLADRTAAASAARRGHRNEAA